MPEQPEYTIVGAGGSIGARLRAHLEQSGHAVYAPSRGDPDLFERPLGGVFYCAGVTADFRARPIETVDAHVGLLRDLLARGSCTSLVYLSSTRVYRGLERGDEEAALALRPGNSDDLYNASKLLGESLCLAAPGLHATVARISNVVGPGANAPSFVRALIDAARETGTIRLETHPESVKDYVDIRDVVELLPRLAGARERIYNVASGRQTTNVEIAEIIASLTGAEVAADERAPAASFPPIGIGRVVQEFAFEPRPLELSLANMLAG